MAFAEVRSGEIDTSVQAFWLKLIALATGIQLLRNWALRRAEKIEDRKHKTKKAPQNTLRKIKELRDEQGKYHCESGPAIAWSDGLEEWWLHGNRHREGGPAITGRQREEWWVDGRLHRTDGPARKYPGYLAWWVNGRLHREGAPAKFYGGGEYWFRNGQLHREDGPAYIYPATSPAASAVVYRYGKLLAEKWYRNGHLHRDGQPAVQIFDADGSLREAVWWQNGRKHREDGPAVVNKSGKKEWWLNGRKLNAEQSYAWHVAHIDIRKAGAEERFFWLKRAAQDKDFQNVSIDSALEELQYKLSAQQLARVNARLSAFVIADGDK